MTTDPLETFEPKEQSKASVPSASALTPARTQPKSAPKAQPSEMVEDDVAGSVPTQRVSPHLSLPHFGSMSEGNRRLIGFALAFVGGALASLFLLSLVAFAYAGSYNNRVLPGVHAGSVDLSGLTRDEAMAKLQAGYAYLGQGEVTVTTPVGVATITYQQVSRGPDVEAMADAAMAVGHDGNPIASAASVGHSAVFGENIPVVIRVDPSTLAQRIRDLVGTSSVAPQDAQASAKGGSFSYTRSEPGHGVDERAIGAAIIDQLTQADAPADLKAGGTFVALQPSVSDADAQKAIDQAKAMASVDVTLTWSTRPAAAPSSWKPQTWKIPSSEISGWILFGIRSDGTYGPTLDPAQVEAYLVGITAKASIPPVQPTVKFVTVGGQPTNPTGGTDGIGVDPSATTAALSAYLEALASGGSAQASVEVVAGPIHPQMSTIDTAGMKVIGKWTTTFYPGSSNGDGDNIRVPANKLNGDVIGPGQQFSFMDLVGPIDKAHGYAMGGVIVGGHSQHVGAIGGGICSASTTMFNAAFLAGLQIDERHAHFYYIDRYPVGRDATIYSNGSTTWDLKWTNDTPYPIVVQGWTTYGYNSTVTFQLWSVPLTGAQHRKVTYTEDPVQTDPVKATNDPPWYVSSIKPGVTYVAEYATDGFKTSVSRKVTLDDGTVLHNDTWDSVYGVVNGLVQIGGTPPPSTTPSPKSTPSPTGGASDTPAPPAPTPVPTPVPPAPTPVPTPVITPAPPSPAAPASRRRRKAP
jgi:vancomycin resistance protein YoaR